MIRRHSERARYSSTSSKSSWISFRRPSILSRDSGLLATSHLQKWALPRNEWVKSCCLCITQALQNGLPLPRRRRIGLNLLEEETGTGPVNCLTLLKPSPRREVEGSLGTGQRFHYQLYTFNLKYNTRSRKHRYLSNSADKGTKHALSNLACPQGSARCYPLLFRGHFS